MNQSNSNQPNSISNTRNTLNTPNTKTTLQVDSLLREMTLAEKAALVNGASFFGTAELPRLGIGRMQFLDGGTGINFEQLFGDFYSVRGTVEGVNGMIGSEALGHVIEFFYEPERLTEDELEMRAWVKKLLDERTGMPELAPGCFPPGILLGATFCPEAVRRVGEALGMEAQAYGIDVLLGTPNVNILRDPLNGRLFEGYSEDPCLVAKLAPELVLGVQEYPVMANVKHFAANNQETNRIGINETISKRALEEIYLPGFRACVQDGGVRTVMSAYNRINGTACTENRWLLVDTLREEWGFDGFVMSDWGAVYHPAAAVAAGNDLAMPGPRDASPIVEAVQNGTLTEEALDEAVRNILRAFSWLEDRKGQAKLQSLAGAKKEEAGKEASKKQEKLQSVAGVQAEEVGQKAGEKQEKLQFVSENVQVEEAGQVVKKGQASLQSAASGQAEEVKEGASKKQGIAQALSADELMKTTDAAAYEAAAEGIVLLKNENGIFPIVPEEKRSVVLTGTGCEELVICGSGSAGITTNRGTSLPKCLKEILGEAQVEVKPYVVQSPQARQNFGLAEDSQAEPQTGMQTRLQSLVGTEPQARQNFGLAEDSQAEPQTGMQTRLQSPVGAEMQARLAFELGAEEAQAGTQVELQTRAQAGLQTRAQAEPQTELQTELQAKSQTRLQPCMQALPQTILVIASLSGMEGNDRPDMELALEDRMCIEELIAAKKQGARIKLGLLLNTCGPVAIAEYEPYLDGIFWMFLPGMQGARAMADLLTGRRSPSGKLPLSYPKRYEDTPTFLNFPGDGCEVNYGEGIYVGYRYYDKKKIEPLYAFGYGLSYTDFWISEVETDKDNFTDELAIFGKIKNTGNMAGAEVVQVYISDVASSQSKPVKELKAFQKIYLQPGEEREFRFVLTERDFRYFDMDYDRFLSEEGYFEILVATSSRKEDIAAVELVYLNCECPYSYGLNSTIKVFYENAALKGLLLEWWAREHMDRGILDSNYQYTSARKLSEIASGCVDCNPESNERLREFLEKIRHVIKA